MVLWADDLKIRPCLFWCEWVCVEGGSGPWFVAVALHHIGFPARPPFFRSVASALGVVCDRAVQAATAFGANLSIVVIGHQKAEAVGCAHPSTAETVQRCVIFRVEGNSDEFVITLTTQPL